MIGAAHRWSAALAALLAAPQAPAALAIAS